MITPGTTEFRSRFGQALMDSLSEFSLFEKEKTKKLQTTKLKKKRRTKTKKKKNHSSHVDITYES